MRPGAYFERISRSMRGHLPICPSSDAAEPSRKRLCMPSVDFDSRVMWV